MASIDVEAAACSAGPVDLRIGCSRTKFEIPFGHAFDKRGVSSSKSAVRVGGPSVFDQPSRSAPYNTALRSNDRRIGEVNHHVGAGQGFFQPICGKSY